MQRWWKNWRVISSILPEGVFFSEIQLSVPILDHRLVAQYDRLIVTESGQLYIADWKTGLRASDQTVHAASWQTRVYRFIAVEAGHIFIPKFSVNPSDVLLSYWHADAPDALQVIPYSAREHERVRDDIEQSVGEKSALSDEIGAFSQCDNREACGRCTYVALCERESASVDTWEEDTVNATEEIENPW